MARRTASQASPRPLFLTASRAFASASANCSRPDLPTWSSQPQAARSTPAGESVRKSSSCRSRLRSAGRKPYPSASMGHLLAARRQQPVAVLGAPRTTVPESQLGRPQAAEVVEVPAGGDPAHPGRLGDRGRGQPRMGPDQGLDHEVEGGVGEALGQGLGARAAKGAEDAVDLALVGLAEPRHAGPGAGVRAQLLLEGGEPEGLDQVVDDPAPHGAAQALHVAGGGDRDHVDRRVVILPEPAQHLQARHVGQVEVEQRQVGPQLENLLQGFAAAGSRAHHRETRHSRHVRLVQLGDPEVVLDHQGPNHGRVGTCSGSRAVKTAPAPRWLATSISPAWLRAISRARANPIPRRRPPVLDLVLNPSSKPRLRSVLGTPAPESWTRTTRSAPAVTETATQRSPVDTAAASSALSIRFPTSVIRSPPSSTFSVSTVSSETRSSTPRSEATAALASRSAPRTGSPMRSSRLS